jgi:polyphosphate kinase
VESDIKKHARLNMMAHLLSTIPYAPVPGSQVELPERLTSKTGYQRPPRELSTYVPDYAATMMAKEAKAS